MENGCDYMEKLYCLRVGQYTFNQPMTLEEAIAKMDRMQAYFLKMELVEYDSISNHAD